MAEADQLEKTNRINMLFDFYGGLLTEKQRTYLSYYFHEDWSLGEIAAEFAISRQAIYEHIKRAVNVLEEYERKLRLLAKYERRLRTLQEAEALVAEASFPSPERREAVLKMFEQLKTMD